MNHLMDYDGPRYWGKFKALVRQNNDPERRVRIRCYCPQVMGPNDDDRHWTGWAEPCLPWIGGLNTADFGPPLTRDQNGGEEVGVWLEFEGGIPDFPIWVGTWLPAPTPTSPNAQIDLDSAAGVPGSSIVQADPGLSGVNPIKPLKNAREVRLYAKEGFEILLGVDKGGHVLIGPMGVHLDGLQVDANGRLVSAYRSDKVVG